MFHLPHFFIIYRLKIDHLNKYLLIIFGFKATIFLEFIYKIKLMDNCKKARFFFKFLNNLLHQNYHKNGSYFVNHIPHLQSMNDYSSLLHRNHIQHYCFGHHNHCRLCNLDFLHNLDIYRMDYYNSNCNRSKGNHSHLYHIQNCKKFPNHIP